MKYFLLCAVLFSPIAFGQMTCPPQTTVPLNAILLCWVNATTDKAGNQLPLPPDAGSLKQTRIQRVIMVPATLPCDFGAGLPIETINLTPDVGSYYWTKPQKVGRHCMRARHINTRDEMSDWSSIVDKVIATLVVGRPSPPTSLTVYGGSNAPTATYTEYPNPEEDDIDE
jgi:hypothetical protein